jgi:hypothetical protein
MRRNPHTQKEYSRQALLDNITALLDSVAVREDVVLPRGLREAFGRMDLPPAKRIALADNIALICMRADPRSATGRALRGWRARVSGMLYEFEKEFHERL